AVFDSSGRVTVQALAANLVGASDKQPAISGRVLANGVYVASGDGKNASGGIYVMGDASDMMLSTSGTDQIYTITQGSTVTTITVSQTNNTTTISSGTNTTKLSGIPMNNADPSNPAPGAALYVNGNINALHGPKGGGKTGPAIAPGTALTITGSRMITVTGDLTYANPVVDGSGNALASDSTIKNVLGIFTADGNVGLAPDSTYTSSGLSLEIDAAISTFNTNTSDDNGKIEGSITYTGSNKTSNTDLWKLVGSRVQASINNIGYSKRNIYFDPRFSGGTFAPPFYPGTSYALSNVTTTTTSRPAVASFVQPGSQAVSWFRTSN
ncbi:MAG TPA: hypothetical protein VJX67_19430, partial [Blastocatellia bacterium]|nr:hypothetical protein [Blastocatellia bacterium]